MTTTNLNSRPCAWPARGLPMEACDALHGPRPIFRPSWAVRALRDCHNQAPVLLRCSKTLDCLSGSHDVMGDAAASKSPPATTQKQLLVRIGQERNATEQG